MKTMKIMGSDCHLQHLTNHVQRSPWLCCSNTEGCTRSSLSLSVSLSLFFLIRILLAMVFGGLLECSEQGPLNGRDQSRGEHLATQQC